LPGAFYCLGSYQNRSSKASVPASTYHGSTVFLNVRNLVLFFRGPRPSEKLHQILNDLPTTICQLHYFLEAPGRVKKCSSDHFKTTDGSFQDNGWIISRAIRFFVNFCNKLIKWPSLLSGKEKSSFISILAVEQPSFISKLCTNLALGVSIMAYFSGVGNLVVGRYMVLGRCSIFLPQFLDALVYTVFYARFHQNFLL